MKKAILLLFVLIFISSVSAVNINSVNSVEIEPGKTGIISLDIENNHDFDVKDVSIILDFKDAPIAPYFSSAEAFIGDLDEGDEESISFNIIASANAGLGLYKIPVLISYVDLDNEKYDKIDFISVIIVSDPKVEAFLDDPNYIIGNKGDISIQIVNKGLSDIKFLTVEVKDTTYYDLVSLDEVYIGDLNSDDFDSADFSLVLGSPLPTRFNLPIKLTYYDANNKMYIEESTLSVSVYSFEEAKQLGLINNVDYSWVVVIILVLIISFIIYRFIKKRRKKSRMNRRDVLKYG